MPLALMLSPDDQAVSVITAVLEEMSVTCERPLDGASAAQKLNSHSFDLVLVDCENLPAAKLIFDVCRRAKGNNHPVPIAIVDGRAGLPTAFRLGAELILTKPVAKDQARSTIRTAVGRVKRDEPARSNASTDLFNPPASDAVPVNAGQDNQAVVEPAAQAVPERALGAVATSGLPQLTSFDDPVPLVASANPAVTSPQSAPVAILEIEKRAAVLEAPAVVTEPRHSAAMTPSDDPVVADLEKAETAAKANIPPPVLFPYSQAKPKKERSAQNEDTQASKSRGPLVAVLALVLAGAGLYAAWMYEPGFKALAQPQVDRVLTMVGVARPLQPQAATPGKPAEPAKVVPATSADSSQASQPGATNASDGTNPSATDSAASTAPSSSAATPAPAASTTAVTTAASESTAAPAGKPNKIDVAVAGQKSTLHNAAAGLSNADLKTTASVAPADAELPGEKNTVILSSKGADKRLIHSVQPTYPAGVNPVDVQGTLVLKAVIDENGNVAGARVIEGNSALAHAAIAAVKQWHYRPYVRDGKALPFQTIVLVDFQRR